MERKLTVKNHRAQSKEFFNLLDEHDKNLIMECASFFHYRTGKENDDGSMGIIDITPGMFKDILAYAIIKGGKGDQGT